MSNITVLTGPAALEELPDLKPGVELALLIEAYAGRLDELDGYQLVEFRAAVERQIAHLEAVGLRTTRELSLRPPGFEPVASPAPLRHRRECAVGELKLACGWSRWRADHHFALAQELAGDLGETLAGLDAGEFGCDVAREIADGTKVFARQLLNRRRVEAAVLVWIRKGLDAGMPRPRHEVRKRVQAEVLRVDPAAADKRHAKQVEDRNFGVTAAENSTADLKVTNLPADQAAEAYAHVNSLARVAKRRGDERSMPQLRADIAASLLSGSANVIDCPSQQPNQLPGEPMTPVRLAGRVVLVTTLKELLGQSSGGLEPELGGCDHPPRRRAGHPATTSTTRPWTAKPWSPTHAAAG